MSNEYTKRETPPTGGSGQHNDRPGDPAIGPGQTGDPKRARQQGSGFPVSARPEPKPTEPGIDGGRDTEGVSDEDVGAPAGVQRERREGSGGSRLPGSSQGRDDEQRGESGMPGSSKGGRRDPQGQGDSKIGADVERAITGDGGGNAGSLQITVKMGLVTLRGRVRSQAEKDSAGSRAKSVSGVNGVDNQLEVSSM